MWSIILILLGISAEIVMANSWFVIPEFVPYLLFGIAGLLAVIQFFAFITVRKQAKNITRRWR